MSDVAQNKPPLTALHGKQELRVLLVEDSEFDAELLVRHLRSHGYQTQHQRVASQPEMEKALSEQAWDVVLCDYQMPDFSVLPALALLKRRGLDLPFIIVSGALGEELAVKLMKAGAHDFIFKDQLSRLVPAIEREWREAKARREQALALEKISFLAAIVDSSEEAIMGENMAGIITTWNAGATRLYGYEAAEAVGRPALLIVPPSHHQEAADLLQKLWRAQYSEPVETIRMRKDGAPVNVCVTMSAIRDGQGRILGASSIAYDITERKKIEAERTELIAHLNQTLAKIKTLSGLLPICASCKKIRDDHGYWQKLETFVHEHSDAEFSHSICPDCMIKLYPEYASKITDGKGESGRQLEA
jgi:two-component system, cell cycle sensor histidine kinase and response regulator CckA